MKNNYSFLLGLLFIANIFYANGNTKENGSDPRVSSLLRGSGMVFTENKGQIVDREGKLRPDILYTGSACLPSQGSGNPRQGEGANVYLRKTGISYVYSNMTEVQHEAHEKVEEWEHSAEGLGDKSDSEWQQELMQKESIKVNRVDMDFVNANTNIRVINEDELQGFTNYYYAHCPDGVLNVKQYNRVTYKNIYNGIDIKYYASPEQSRREEGVAGLKYDLIVKPYSDPNQIKFRWTGAESITLNSEGRLVIKTSINEFYESIPRVYQIINGQVVDVRAAYKLVSFSQGKAALTVSGDGEVTFELGTYDPEWPLIIDPATWFTYYGGSGVEYTGDIALDGVGNIVFTGSTRSSNFPVSVGAQQGTYASAFGTPPDAYCVKLTAAGALIWATYYGGNSGGVNGEDYGYSVVCDGLNNVIFCGSTGTSNLPMGATAGNTIHQNTTGGSYDNFLVKLNPSGTRLWSTFYGGAGYEFSSGSVGIDNANNVILCGSTMSATNIASIGALQPVLNGSTDAYIAKFNSTGIRQWSTYCGGSNIEGAGQPVTDNANNIYFAGSTDSPNFPVSGGAHQVVLGGSRDGFIAKFDAGGSKVWATYYGGTLDDACRSIALDGSGNLIVYGTTAGSTTGIATAGAPLPVLGSSIGFLVKFNNAGVRLWGTYDGMLIGTGNCDMALDANNNIYLYSEWEDSAPPSGTISSCAYQDYFGGGFGSGSNEDVYIAKYDPNGKKTCLTAIGGTQEDDLDGNGGGAGIVIDGNYLYIIGWTSGSFPVTSGALQAVFGGGSDAFVGKLCINICEAKVLGLNFTPSSNSVCANASILFNSSVSNTCDTTGYRYQWTFAGGNLTSSTAANPSVTYSAPGTYPVKLVLTTICKKDSITKMIVVNPSCVISVTANGSAICPNTCTVLTANGASGTSPYTYSWSTGATTQTINVCPTTNTNYLVTVKDAFGNTASAPVSVIIYSPIVTTPISTNITCTTDGSARVFVNSAALPYVYSWSNGSTGSSIQMLPPGNYSVTVTDGNGCTKVDPYTIASNSPSSATFSFPTPICVGQNVCFTHTGSAGSANWRIDPIGVTGTTVNFCYTFLSAGTYSVNHVASNGGCINRVTQGITVTNCGATPAVTATGSSVCPGICATVTSSGAGGTSPYSYSWSNGAITQNISPCPTSTTTYTVTIIDNAGITASSTAVVTVNSAVTVTTMPTNINCNGGTGSATATGSSGTGPYTYSWSTGGTTSQISNLTSQIYTITVTDSKGCTSTATAAIISPPPFIGQFTKGNASCVTCNCKEWIMVNATGGINPYSYVWPDGYVNRYKNQLCPGTYTINIKDKNGCSVNVSVVAP